MNRSACLLLGLTIAAAARASDIYRWTDEKGDPHYTDDLSTIPADRRAKAQKTQGGNLTVIGSGARPPAQSTNPSAPEGQSENPSGDERPPPAPTEEETWRGKFKSVHERIRQLEDQLTKDRATFEDPGAHGMSSTAYVRGILVPNPELAKIKDRIDQEESDLQHAQSELHELDRKATFAGVPRDWRR